MSTKSYISSSGAVILQSISNGYKYGFDIMDVSGLPSGTVYPALRRLEEMQMVRSKWEKASIAQDEQRPPRKYYEITQTGKTALTEAVKRYRFLDNTISGTARKPKLSEG